MCRKKILSKIGRLILIISLISVSIQQSKQAEAFILETAIILGAGALLGISAGGGSGDSWNSCDNAWKRSNSLFESAVGYSKREEWVEAATAFKNSETEWERTSANYNCSTENRSRAAKNMAIATRNYNITVKNALIVECDINWKDSQETSEQGLSSFRNSDWSSAAATYKKAAEKWKRTASLCQVPEMKNGALENMEISNENARNAENNAGVVRSNERCTRSWDSSLSASNQAHSYFNQGLWVKAASAFHRAAGNWESTASECSIEATRQNAFKNKAAALENERLANGNNLIVQKNTQIQSCSQSFDSSVSLYNEANSHLRQNDLKQAKIVLQKAEQSWDTTISLCVQDETLKARQAAIKNKKETVRIAQEVKCKELDKAVLSAAHQVDAYIKDGKWNEATAVLKDAAVICDKAVSICSSDDVKKVFRENKARFMEAAKATDQNNKIARCKNT